MKNKGLLLAGVILLLTLIIVLLYSLAFRHMVILACHGKAEAWFINLINTFYPRFAVERFRFSPEFFLAKADQVIIRFSFVSLLSCIILILTQKNQLVKNSISQFFNQSLTITTAKIIRILYFLCIIILFYDIYWVLKDLSLMKAFYKPLPILNLLHIEFPSMTTITIVCLLIYASSIMGILNFYPIINSIIVLLLFIYIQGIIFSFEKIDHGFAPMTYAGMIIPFLLLQVKESIQKKSTLVPGWPLQLIQLLICLCYFFAGIEKIFIGGLEWINPITFKTYLLIHHTKVGIWIASNNILCTLLPTAALLFQIGFISILFYKKLIPYFLIGGILFHVTIYYLFDVGGILHPWILSYFFFINWKTVTDTFKLKN